MSGRWVVGGMVIVVVVMMVVIAGTHTSESE